MQNTEHHKKKLVFAVLNWGIGHASRSVPLINKYKAEGWEITLASDGLALEFLRKEFPKERCVDIKSISLRYSKRSSLLAHLWYILPAFIRNIRADKAFVNQFVETEKIDLIISDNRYGFRSSKVKSIIVSHQLQLAFPDALKWGRPIVQTQINKWLNRFDECWIVDDSKHCLADNLSYEKALKIPYRFLGLLSRLEPKKTQKDIDFLVVLSGLEPQRSILEKILIRAFNDYSGNVFMVGGRLGEDNTLLNKIQYLSFADSDKLNSLMNRANCVISRSGFSSIMDLLKLNKKAILIPTPKQIEQEYLAQIHSKNPLFTIAQNDVKSIKEKINNC